MPTPSANNPSVSRLHLSDEMKKVADGRHHDPFSVLGYHQVGDAWEIRVFNPLAEQVVLLLDDDEYAGATNFRRIPGSDFFVLQTPELLHYRLQWHDKFGQQHIGEDTFKFAPTITDFDLYLFNQGDHRTLYDMLGAKPMTLNNVAGVRFAVWAPSAKRVSVVGEFNGWDGRIHAMRSRGSSGVWEIFITQVDNNQLYKFEILGADDKIRVKQDPFANAFQLRPETACKVYNSKFEWSDDQWIERRRRSNWQNDPASIYEVHLGSWQRNDTGEFHNYKTLAHKLVEYVLYMGYSHIELMPITEHPLDDSWGYQVTGYFAATSRFGTADELRYFIDYCHVHGIGVILDWVPAHFPKDEYSLARFDGTCLFEHEDPRKGEHRDWGTLIFNYGRNEVRNFLIASALYWLREFHVDGLRVDAVASMLYLDYSREQGDWVPNEYGGRENLDAVEFLRHLNSVTHTEVPGTIIIAEESTSWPQVTRPPDSGGLGFSMKWNMGWMHDTLEYMNQDPVHRSYHHHKLTFGLLYLHSENFVLPFSHDEVVHGKGSMINKMPGDNWQQFANLRLLYSYQFTYPGKKLMFQGAEFAQRSEWNFSSALDWSHTDAADHRGIMTLVSDLNRLYREKTSLHARDFSDGFDWINADDSDNSVISYIRKDDTKSLIIVLNFTPIPRENYAVGVDSAGQYKEIFNSDSERYGGGNVGNHGMCQSVSEPYMGKQCKMYLTLPPLGAVIFEHSEDNL